MPILPTYTAQLGGAGASGGRRASAEDFGATDFSEANRAVQRAGMGFIEKSEEDEARRVLVRSSELRAKYAKALDEAALNGSDIEKLREQMNDDFAKIGEEFQTKRGMESLSVQTSNTNLMFQEQANAIAVQRAAASARLDGSKLLNSDSAVIQSNPGYLKAAEANVDALLATYAGKLPPAKIAELANELKQDQNMAAAMASARIDPAGTKRRLEAGEWNLKPEQRSAAMNKADSEIRSARAEDAWLRAEAEKERLLADETARDKHFKDIMAGAKGVRRAIMDDANLRPATREHLITFMEHRAKEAAGTDKKSDPTVVRDLWLRIHAPDSDPRKIYNGDAIFEAVSRGNVNTNDANLLNTLVANQKDENNRSFGQRLGGRMQAVIGAMRTSPEFQAQPELAAAIQIEMTSRVERAASTLRKEGKSPDGLLDPESKDYFFKPGIIKSVADDLKARQREDLIGQAARVKSVDDLLKLKDGDVFVDDSGTPKTLTPALRASFEKQRKGAQPGAVEGGALDPLFRAIDELVSGKRVATPPKMSEATRNYLATRDKAALERWDMLYGLMDAVFGKGAPPKQLSEATRRYWAAQDQAALQRWDALYAMLGGK